MKLNPFGIERYFARYEFSARYMLSSSDCEAMSTGDLLTMEPGAAEQFQRQWLGYTESAGDPELRQLISEMYDRIEADQVLVHSGAEEAIFNFMNALLKPGDHVIVHYPCYQSLHEIAQGIGCEVTKWETHEENGWELDLDFLRAKVRPETRALVVNCPHNPTGYLMSGPKQAAIMAIAREHNLLLFSDEVYRLLEQDPADRLPPACDLYENAVSLGVMSKTFGLPGLRIGWVASRNPQVLAAMAGFKDYLTICNSAPSEFLAKLALRHKEAIVGRNLEIVTTNLGLLDAFFERHRAIFNWTAPRAGSIAFPSLKIEQPIDQFCQELVERKGVMLLPGTVYDWGHKNFRLGFGRKNLPEALAQLDEFLTENYP